jgi:hypothetical protein
MRSVPATSGKLFILYRPMINSVAMQGNNMAAVFSMRSVPATIGKLFILYRPMVNSVAMQCNNRAACFLCGPITGFIKPVIKLLFRGWRVELWQ